jgi:plastocyanin
MPKTFAMRVYAATYWFLAILFVYILVVLILPMLATSPEVGAFLPLVVAFLGVFVAGAAIVSFMASAPRRRWLWLALLVPPVLFLLLNAPFIPFALTHPTDIGFTAIMPLVVATIVLIVAGVASFRQARAGGAAVDSSLRARWATALVVGATLGAFATGLVAAKGGGSASGGTLAAAPTTSASLVAEGTKYLTPSYSMTTTGVLGLFVANRDSFAHSFDVDSLNIHLPVPANTTVAVAIKPTTAGTLEFYCALPGHKVAGMVGTIDVQ